MQIEEIAERVLTHLQNQPEGRQEAMKLKLDLEISASKLFLALGWLAREGQITLGDGEYGFVAECRIGTEKTTTPKIAERV